MAGFVRNDMQYRWTAHDMAVPQLYKDIPNWEEILEDLQQEDQSLVFTAPVKLHLSPQHFQQQLQHQNLQSCVFLPRGQFPETEQNQVPFQNQISPNAELRADYSNVSESERVMSSQGTADTIGALTAAEQRYQQQSYQQQLCPQASPQSNPLQMPHSPMFMQTPLQTIDQTAEKSSHMSPVRQTESQLVVLSPARMRNVQDVQEFRKIFKQIRKKLGLRQDAVALDLSIMYCCNSDSREISRFEQNNLSYENMWQLKGLLERWLQDNDSDQMRNVRNMLQFSKIFKEKRLERGFSQGEAASAIRKRSGCCINRDSICKFEDFSMSLNYMCRLKPLLQRWLKDTNSPSTCSMHFPPTITTLVTTSMVRVTHPSPKADCDSSAASIDRQLNSARSDDTQKTTSQVLRLHLSSYSRDK